MEIDIEKIIANMPKDVILNIMRNNVEKNCETMFKLSYNWRKQHKATNEKIDFAYYMFQQHLANMRAILELSNGIEIYSNHPETKVIEPTTIISIVRSVYERMFIFHCIYVLPETEIEQDILFYLWIIKGLKNRQVGYVPQEFKEKKRKERAEINQLIAQIKDLSNRLNIIPDAINKIVDSAIDKSLTPKGYKYIKDANHVIIDFKEISLSKASIELMGENFPPIYNYFSMHTHSSYLGTLQFSQLFDKEVNKDFMQTLIVSIALFQGKIISDFVNSVEGVKEIFETLPKEEQENCRMNNQIFLSFKKSNEEEQEDS